jgi:pimeloyl-ACP methyl ester carboxylesterase
MRDAVNVGPGPIAGSGTFSEMSTFVLIHGMAHGGWCWQPIVERLQQHDHRVIAPDLPLTGLADDANSVGELLDSLDGTKILVGHSYAGLVISRAAADRSDIEHLVYIAATMIPGDADPLAAGMESSGEQLVAALEFSDDGWMNIVASEAVAAFYSRCSPDEAAAAVERLRPTAIECLTDPSGGEPWRNIDSTYVLCQADAAVRPESQREMSARATKVVEVDTDHSPFLSSPDRLTEILLTVAP